MTLTSDLTSLPMTASDPMPSSSQSAGGIVVATDGTRDADGAVRVGIALARRDGVRAELLSVVEPSPADAEESAADAERLTTITRESREAALRAQRERTLPDAREWACTIEIGDRVTNIVAEAERTHARLIVLGLGAHGMTARLFRRETALRVIRAARTPVLAVPADARGVPRSALAAIDFTASSEDAARSALALLGGQGTLYLAHVAARIPIPQGDPRSWEEITSPGVRPRLENLAHRLDIPPGVSVETVVLRGDPAHELMAFADQFNVDVISVGAHGRSALSRLVLGSVSTKLVRSAACQVLVVPASAHASNAGEKRSA